MNHVLSRQLSFRRDGSLHATDQHAVIILKPGYGTEIETQTTDFLTSNGLSLVARFPVTFSRESLLAIYNDIYRFSPADLQFGTDWKDRKITYMQSGPSLVLVVRGADAQPLCERFKYDIRTAYGKLSVPDRPLSGDEFEELAIKNIVHVVDDHETEVALWLFADYLPTR